MQVLEVNRQGWNSGSEKADGYGLMGDGIEAHLAQLANNQTNVASTLLSHAADLIVMGGYGHSRLREIVLGGTTRTILHTMTVPVLVAH